MTELIRYVIVAVMCEVKEFNQLKLKDVVNYD